MFNVEDSYLEDEVRDGFYIPSISKRAFAAELSLLYELNRICEKYGLKYFADWGTLLGAIRHRGFIPWDDDLDVCMHRNDLEKLVEVSKHELKDGFEIHSFENNDYSWKFIYNLVNTEKMNFQPEYLKTHYNFPYIATIDIFVLDNLSDDEEYEEKRRQDVKFLLDVADLTTEENLASAEYRRALEAASKVAGSKIIVDGLNPAGLNATGKKLGFGLNNREGRQKAVIDIKRKLYGAAQDILRKQNDHDTEYLVQMVPWGIYHKRKIHSSYYKESVSVPFENTTISVSKKYYSLFRNHKYGNFWEIRMGVGGHGYPYYNAQREALGTDLDYVLHYKFSKEQMEKDASVKDGSLKVIAGEYKEYLRGACDENLAQLQENAINFGELVERTLGDNTQTVKALEHYCEELYYVSQGENRDLDAAIENVVKCIETEILQRRCVVFHPFKGEYFESFRPFYDAEMAKDDTDVYVYPLPYFYKEYNGTFKGEAQYDLSKYPEDVELCDFNSIEMALLYPDAIYIQNPYDEFNMAMSVPNYFYASNLKNMTDELIYVPWFTTSDFAADNYPQTYNMQFYCPVPGVVVSDTVYVSSETIRTRYIEHLTEFSNGECKDIWESKIKVTPYPASSKPNLSEISEILNKDKSIGDDVVADFLSKKIICFYTSPSAMLEYNEKYFDKINRCIDTFKAASENISVIWHIEPYELEMIQSCDPGIYDSLNSIIRSLASTNIHVDHDMSESNLTNACAAFYGDGSHLSKDFVISGKPVMILNLDV